jgi:uncharacterized caspase-like protein
MRTSPIRRTTATFLGVALAIVALSGGQVRAESGLGQKYALLIGVNQYSPPFQNLEFCHNDIEALKQKLLGAGFPEENITLMRDGAAESRYWPSKANIEGQLALRLGLANEEDLVLVAFSGHGVQLEGASYVCPSDTNITQLRGTMVSLDAIYQALEACRARQKVLLVDACRNEPLLKGIKAPTDLKGFAADLSEPPKGLRVLASCEAGQWSAEDPKLKHGVFMYYVTEGLEGHADREYAGNRNGKVSLFELYTYAHEKTKKHVARSAGILQRPVLRGEMVGVYEIAEVAEGAVMATAASALSEEVADAGSTPMDRLLELGDDFRSKGQLEQAIEVYNTVLEQDPENKPGHQKRGSAYLAQNDLTKAMIDYKLGGLPLPARVLPRHAELKLGTESRGTVSQGQTVYVTQANGDWLWVASVDGREGLRGWIRKDAIVGEPASAEPKSTTTSTAKAASRPAYVSSSGSGYAATASSGYVRTGGSGYVPTGGSRGYYNSRGYSGSPGYYRDQPDYMDSPAVRAKARAAEQTLDLLDRAYDRGAPSGRIRALERQFETQYRNLERHLDRSRW